MASALHPLPWKCTSLCVSGSQAAGRGKVACRGHTGPRGEVGESACGVGQTGGTQGPRARAQRWSQFAKEPELSLKTAEPLLLSVGVSGRM